MSNRKSASQIRRDWWMVCIRERPHGRIINRRSEMCMDDDLRQLIAEGSVLLTRSGAGTMSCPSVRYSLVRAADGQPNPPGDIGCPGCQRKAHASRFVQHALGCPVSGSLYTMEGYLESVQSRMKKPPKALLR